MGKNPVVAVVAAIVLVVAVWLIARSLGFGGGGGGAPHAGWYDLETGTIFGAVDPGDFQTVAAPSGGEAVRARVFACNDCDDADDRFLGFLERYSDEARQVLAEEQAKGNRMMARAAAMAYVEVRGPEDEEWVGAMDPDGLAIQSEAKFKCGGKPPRPCGYAE